MILDDLMDGVQELTLPRLSEEDIEVDMDKVFMEVTTRSSCKDVRNTEFTKIVLSPLLPKRDCTKCARFLPAVR